MEETSETMQENPVFKSRTFKDAAVRQLKGRWKTPVLAVLVCAAIYAVFMGALFPWKDIIDIEKSCIDGYGYGVQDFPFVRYFISVIACMLVEPALLFAFLLLLPKLFNQKEPLKFGEFIEGFAQYGRGMGTFWWKVLWLWLWMVAICIPTVIVGCIIGFAVYKATDNIALFIAILEIISIIPTYAVIIVKSYQYSVADYALVDSESLKVTDSLKVSKKLTQGFKWKLFCIDFSFLGWYLLCCICPVGLLRLSPYYALTKYNAYKYLIKDYRRRNDKADGGSSIAAEVKPEIEAPASSDTDSGANN